MLNFNLFEFNDKTLKYEPISGRVILKLIFFSLFLFFMGLLTSYKIIQNKNNHCLEMKTNNMVKDEKFLPIGSLGWKDSVFNEYENRAKIYLSQNKFKKTPIKAEMLRLAAYNSYELTGILLPVELALAQAKFESGMGTKGRSPINNPFNVGEYDSGTVMWFDNTYSGIEAYYFFMTKNYLSCIENLDNLFNNFVNCDGKRYASDTLYESKIRKEYKNIELYINKKISLNNI